MNDILFVHSHYKTNLLFLITKLILQLKNDNNYLGVKFTSEVPKNKSLKNKDIMIYFFWKGS
jgi:hypothetical protein